MTTEQNYSVNQYLVSNLLSKVQIGEIAIPEIQRPFVWEPDKVTELIDSLFNGFPIGYIKQAAQSQSNHQRLQRAKQRKRRQLWLRNLKSRL